MQSSMLNDLAEAKRRWTGKKPLKVAHYAVAIFLLIGKKLPLKLSAQNAPRISSDSVSQRSQKELLVDSVL